MPLFAEEGIWVDAGPGLSSLACLGVSSPRIPIPYAICPVSQQRPHALTEGRLAAWLERRLKERLEG